MHIGQATDRFQALLLLHSKRAFNFGIVYALQQIRGICYV
jgi:hypothetical protein